MSEQPQDKRRGYHPEIGKRIKMMWAERKNEQEGVKELAKRIFNLQQQLAAERIRIKSLEKLISELPSNEMLAAERRNTRAAERDVIRMNEMLTQQLAAEQRWKWEAVDALQRIARLLPEEGAHIAANALAKMKK
jgi:uncharacterized protein (DUF342 family)